jgi:hypothetical protein
MGMVTAIAFFWSNKPNPAIELYAAVSVSEVRSETVVA